MSSANAMCVEIGALAETSRALDLGPEHPSRAGLVRVQLQIAEQRVTHATIQPGHSHRAAEKLFEVRDYRQILMLADRHDWQSPFTGELGVALVCERLLGLVPPERATAVRTLLAEVARIGSHLGFLSWVPHRLDDHELAVRVRADRDALRQAMLALTGNRLHPMANRLGGLAVDPEPDWLTQVTAVTHSAAATAEVLAAAIDEHVSSDRGRAERGVGGIDADLVDQFGLAGPVARACGLDRDLRRIPGTLAYDQLDWPSLTHDPHPDAWGRLTELAAEVGQSATLAGQLAELIEHTPGPIGVKLSKIIKLPDAEGWQSLEAPWGVAGFHLVSRGGTTPWRLKLRTPTFANVSALERVLVGTPIDRIDLVIASLGWTIGDLDK